MAGYNMTCKQFDSIRVVSSLSFTRTESKSALMWLLSESEVWITIRYPMDMSLSRGNGFSNTIHWIVIYLVDGVFQHLNNRDAEIGTSSIWRSG